MFSQETWETSLTKEMTEVAMPKKSNRCVSVDVASTVRFFHGTSLRARADTSSLPARSRGFFLCLDNPGFFCFLTVRIAGNFGFSSFWRRLTEVRFKAWTGLKTASCSFLRDFSNGEELGFCRWLPKEKLFGRKGTVCCESGRAFKRS